MNDVLQRVFTWNTITFAKNTSIFTMKLYCSEHPPIHPPKPRTTTTIRSSLWNPPPKIIRRHIIPQVQISVLKRR